MNSSFYKKYFTLMIPMALKELIAALVNLVDTIMVGKLGETQIAAAGLSNQVYFLFTVFVFGMCGAAAVLASQYWGKRDIKNVRRMLGLNLILACFTAAVFISAAFVIPNHILGVFTEDTGVIMQGSSYLRIVCWSYIFTAVTMSFDMSLCCTENARLPFISRFSGLFVNIFLNWVLIYGNLGAPALGIEGAAIATLIARVVECAVIISVVYIKKYVQAAKLRELLDIPRDLISRFIRSSLPVIANEVTWSLGMTVYTWIYSQMSTEAVVIITIVQNIERLLLVFFHGGGNACGVIIGNTVGAGKTEEAYSTAKRLCKISILASSIITVVFLFLRPLMLMPYNISPEVYSQTKSVLVVMSVLMNVKALTFILIVGVFRNGGAAKTAMKIDVLSLWAVGIPLVFIAARLLKLPLLYAYIFMGSEEIVKLAISLPYFKSKRWIKNLVS